MHWHEHANARSLPWKQEKDPYKIWLSEVILQQTRAEQGLPYYLKFTETFPTVCDLANANEAQVFRLWQGLGYYNRCKNMLATAVYVCHQLKGVFPDTYEDIIELKGIGPYTAAAIASFAFNRPNAVVDGNVYRVLSRYFGIEIPIDTTEGKQLFANLAQELLDKDNSALYNQAIMDLGATVCTPKLPKCANCSLQKKCIAQQEDTISLLPVKSKKLVVRKRFFNFLLFVADNKIWIHKRTSNDIWQNLHQPYLVESPESVDIKELLQQAVFIECKNGINDIQFVGTRQQRLTHQIIESRFYKINLSEPINCLPNDGMWLSFSELKNYAFPKTLLTYFEK